MLVVGLISAGCHPVPKTPPQAPLNIPRAQQPKLRPYHQEPEPEKQSWLGNLLGPEQPREPIMPKDWVGLPRPE
jgi:hypothetical protein